MSARAPRGAGDIETPLREVELFRGLNGDQLRWLAAHGRSTTLADGEVLFRAGEAASLFYVLVDGELLITREARGQVQMILRCTASPPDGIGGGECDQFIGEVPMLTGGGHTVTATAVGHTELVSFSRSVFFRMLERCPQVCRVVLPVLARRVHLYEAKKQASAMTDGLGMLAAGLAHQLNNPAAALVSGVGELRQGIDELEEWSGRWASVASAPERALVAEVRQKVTSRPTAPAIDGSSAASLAAVEEEDALREWLSSRKVEGPSESGSLLADHGVSVDLLVQLGRQVRADVFGAAVGYLASCLQAHSLVEQITEAGLRMESLVNATKTYADLDRAPEHQLDLHDGLEATLAVRAAALKGVRVHRDYAPLPPVTAWPTQLNQAWTHLIDNAIEAMGGVGDLRLVTRPEGDTVRIEICDSGPGMPDDVQLRLFDPFFTTKPATEGAGLGLHVTRDIVTALHQGTIDVETGENGTRFTVRLPVRRPGRAGARVASEASASD